MSELEGRGVFKPRSCSKCGLAMYSDTAWQNGQVVYLTKVCADCEADE